jgi:hypothetical protein
VKPFEDDWGNQWYEGNMILCGDWYHYVLGQKGQHTQYKLLNDSSPTFACFHLVSKFNFPMLPNATRKRNPWFSMPSKVKESLIATIERR